jgi:hypothetical protein
MRPFIIAAIIIFLPGVFLAFWQSLVWLAATQPVATLIGLGFLCGLICDYLLRNSLPGLRVFEHELTHALAALLCLRKVNSFVVTAHQGGYVSHSGGFGGDLADDFIGLAPYMLPLLAMVSVLIRPWISVEWLTWFDLWIGFTLGGHALRGLRDTKNAIRHPVFLRTGTNEYTRSDIASRGISYSLLFIACFGLALHGLMFFMLLRGYSGATLWAQIVWQHSQWLPETLPKIMAAMPEMQTLVQLR